MIELAHHRWWTYRKRFRPFLNLTWLLVSIATLASSATAQQYTPCLAYGSSVSIFIGNVVAIEPISISLNPVMGGGTYPTNLIRYAVEERFKGDATSSEEAMDGFARVQGKSAFKIGEQYLVYTHSPVRPYDPDVRAQHAVPLLQASAELAYLRGLQKGEPLASVTGKILQHRLDVIDWKLVPQIPPANVRLWLQNSQGVRRETHTDENNTFLFKDVVPGVYKVVIDPPPKLYTPAIEMPVNLKLQPCSHVDFLLQSDGRVSGKIVDADGKPANYVEVSLIPVELMPLDEKASMNRDLHGLGAQTDTEGRYEIRGIPAGQYVLGINLGMPPEPGFNAFPRTFYPGTPDRSRATVIELAEAEQKVNFDFRLPPRLTTRAITGSVVFADGKPAICAMVGLIDARLAKTNWSGTQRRVEPDGHFTLAGIDGYRYAVQAFTPVIDKKGRNVGYLPAVPVEVLATENPEPVKLIMPPEANCDFLTNERPRP